MVETVGTRGVIAKTDFARYSAKAVHDEQRPVRDREVCQPCRDPHRFARVSDGPYGNTADVVCRALRGPDG
jgi:hypothetical protein